MRDVPTSLTASIIDAFQGEPGPAASRSNRFRSPERADEPLAVPAASLVSELHVLMAAEVTSAVDAITARMMRRAEVDLAGTPDRGADIAARLLDFRRDLHQAATRILEASLVGRDDRIERVRDALGLRLRVAAVFLLQLIDDPGRTHCCLAGVEHTSGCSRRASVYISHIRKALRQHGLEEAVITVRARGYQLSRTDAQRISQLWGE